MILEQKSFLKESSKSCTCGRSPTGKCIGGHNLRPEDYKKAMDEWKANQEVCTMNKSQ